MKPFLAACILLATSIVTTICPGLPAKTKILTPNSFRNIETLHVGSRVTSYNPETNSLSSTTVEHITRYTSPSIIQICTEKGTLYAAPRQEFYDATQQKFVTSARLSHRSILITRNFGPVVCGSVKILPVSCLCYELSLSAPHLFFTSDLEVLSHNYLQAFPSVVSSITELAKIGTAIACLYFSKTEKRLPDHRYRSQREINFTEKHELLPQENAWQKIQQKADVFRTSGIALKAPYSDILDTHIKKPRNIAGIYQDEAMFDNLISNPHQFGPICLLGNICSAGDVECALYAMNFDGYEPNKAPRYVWKLLGTDRLCRSNLFVKGFIEAEDRKQLSAIRSLVQEWWNRIATITKNEGFKRAQRDLATNADLFKKEIYGSTFAFQALDSMAEKGIPPSLVLQAINAGPCIPTKDPLLVMHRSQQLNVIVIIGKRSGVIIKVGFFKDQQELDTPPQDEAKEKPKTLEDLIGESTPGEETNGPTKHMINREIKKKLLTISTKRSLQM